MPISMVFIKKSSSKLYTCSTPENQRSKLSKILAKVIYIVTYVYICILFFVYLTLNTPKLDQGFKGLMFL